MKEFKKSENEILYEKADNGDAFSQCRLGLKHYNDKGKYASHDEALKWFYKAAAQDCANANYLCGIILFDRRSLSDAEEYLKKSAELGYGDASYELGKLYSSENSDFFNREEAFKRFLEATERGCKEALEEVANYYGRSQATVENKEKAANYYKKALIEHWIDTFYCLAVAFYAGEGFKKDIVSSFYYLALAALINDDNNSCICHKICKEMSDEEFSAAQKLVADIKKEIANCNNDEKKISLIFKKPMKHLSKLLNL